MKFEADRILEELSTSLLKGYRFREQAMALLSDLDGFDWCGIYRLEGDELVLDVYVGEETDHVRIQVGEGVCGTAVAQDRNQVIYDVREISNYLSCSVATRSEIVVLIRNLDGEILGQIDVDGHEVGTFGTDEERFLDGVAALLAERWH
jgi:GAF domain-containing protein